MRPTEIDVTVDVAADRPVMPARTQAVLDTIPNYRAYIDEWIKDAKPMSAARTAMASQALNGLSISRRTAQDGAGTGRTGGPLAC